VSMQLRRVVTGRDADGTSVVVVDEPVPPIEVGAVPGSSFHLVWGTDDGAATVGRAPQEPREPTLFPFFPGPGGTRFLFVRFPPESSAPEPVGTPEDLGAEAERELPGLMGAFEPDHPGMHTTDSVDYGLCVEGEMWLELDDGREVHLTPGTCVVQRGTRHAWHNRGTVPALMAYVIVGAERTS
jgi:quercetin dioxygenase-like cupin family protein